MGWIWRDDDDDRDGNSDWHAVSEFQNPSNGDGDGEYCSTRRIVKSNCRTEEVEPGKFVRKCEKTEELLRDCLGKPTEVLQSTKEYTEDDVTHEVMRGSSMTDHSKIHPFDFPGIRNDIEAIERLFGGISSFFDAADEMKKEFFRIFDDMPFLESEPPSSSARSPRGIPIQEEPTPKRNDSGSGDIDLSSLVCDV